MPSVEVFRNRRSGEVVLCNYVFCVELGGGDSPTGQLVRMTYDQFIQNCSGIIASEFEHFYTREFRVPSELYEKMTKAQQRTFFRQHSQLRISKPFKNRPQVNVYVGERGKLLGTLLFPFDGPELQELLVRAMKID